MAKRKPNKVEPPSGYETIQTSFQFWKPEEGEVLEGLFSGRKELDNGNAYLIKTEKGELLAIGGYNADIAFTGVEPNRILVWIQFLGKEELKGGKSINLYKFAFKDIEQTGFDF
ncbi:MAG: hypothetical protein GF317_19245 [Candidatus Lokiarchaeota archaeon]|nr:hypothetical protein [Candidatus Lokiarchaeota archaeon]